MTPMQADARARDSQNETQSRYSGAEARRRLVAGLPVTERAIESAGIRTAVLEGGEGPPMVLLHGPSEYGAKWFRVIPDLVTTYHVVAPDLPGHGATDAHGEALGADRVLSWLGALIEQTCGEPPVLVGQILGGAIAARFAASRHARIRHLVLCDALGLAPFEPAPEFGRALMAFVGQPNEETHEDMWRQCAFDLDTMRAHMGESWGWIEAYNLDRAQTESLQPTQRALMEELGFPPIDPEILGRIEVPTDLIWGREDLATRLSVAQSVSERYGWPLRVIEAAADDPPMEQPEAFLAALRSALGGPR